LAEIFGSTQDLIDVLERPKLLVMPCRWLLPDHKSGERQVRLKGALLDGIATLRGVSLSIGCNQDGFELPMHLTLLAEFKGKPRAFARIDINSSPHVNRHVACGELQLMDAGPTHFHDTLLHQNIPIDKLFSPDFGALPIARPISDMPTDFRNAMEKCGEILHIDNLTEIEEPQWQPRQLPF
jgi:hypothetical protein